MAATLILAEPSGGYVTDWYCDPPPPGARFAVTREEWVTGHDCDIRRIEQVQLAP